jgi:hypothetical protein
MFERLTRPPNKSPRTGVPNSIAGSAFGSRNPSGFSIHEVMFLPGGDARGSRQSRYYNNIQVPVPLERTHSHHIPPSKKAATTYFTRKSRLPYWVNPDWVLPTRQRFDRFIHPHRWRDHQEDLTRRDRSEGLPNHYDPDEDFSQSLLPISHENTANYPTVDETFERDRVKARELASKPPGPSAKSKTSRRKKLPPRFGRLQKRDEANGRAFITTIGSFVSRMTRRVLDHFERRTSDCKGQLIQTRLKKGGARFPIEADNGDGTNTLVLEPSSTVHLPVEVPSPGTLNIELNTPPHEHTSKQAPRRLTKKPPPATASPASSIHRPNLADKLDKKTDRRPSYHSTHTPLSNPRRKTPSPQAPPRSRSSSIPSSNMTSSPVVPKIDLKFPFEGGNWGDLGVNASPPSEAGDSCISGTTAVSSRKEGSVSSACDYRANPLKQSAATISELQRVGSGASTISGTTAGSVEYWKSSEEPLRKTQGPHFIPQTRNSVVPQQIHLEIGTPSWWKDNERGVEDRYSQRYSRLSTGNASHTKGYQFAHPGLHHSARTGRSGVMA